MRRALASVVALLAIGCCITNAIGGYAPTCIWIDDLHVTGDASHLVIPFSLMDDDDHHIARSGHVRVEIRDLPPRASSIEQGSVACAYERDVAITDFSGLYPQTTIDATFTPPCPPPPVGSARLERQAAFWFTSPGTSFPPFPIRQLPPALQNQTD